MFAKKVWTQTRKSRCVAAGMDLEFQGHEFEKTFCYLFLLLGLNPIGKYSTPNKPERTVFIFKDTF